MLEPLELRCISFFYYLNILQITTLNYTTFQKIKNYTDACTKFCKNPIYIKSKIIIIIVNNLLVSIHTKYNIFFV